MRRALTRARRCDAALSAADQNPLLPVTGPCPTQFSTHFACACCVLLVLQPLL
jgi:hypothetical protein